MPAESRLVEWLFDFDNEENVKRMPDVVLAMLTDAEAAKAKVAEAQKVVRNRQTATVDELKRHLD